MTRTKITSPCKFLQGKALTVSICLSKYIIYIYLFIHLVNSYLKKTNIIFNNSLSSLVRIKSWRNNTAKVFDDTLFLFQKTFTCLFEYIFTLNINLVMKYSLHSLLINWLINLFNVRERKREREREREGGRHRRSLPRKTDSYWSFQAVYLTIFSEIDRSSLRSIDTFFWCLPPFKNQRR